MKEGDKYFETHASKASELLAEYNCHKQYSSCYSLYREFYNGIKATYDSKINKRTLDRINKLSKDRNKKMEELEEEYQRTHCYEDVHLKDMQDYRMSIHGLFNNEHPVETLREFYIDLRQGSEKPYVSVSQSAHYDTTNGIFVVTGDFNSTGVIKDLNLKEVMEQETSEGM